MELENLLKRINKTTTYKKLSDLTIGQKYPIDNIKLVKTKYGKSLLVHTDEFDCYLPDSWKEKFSPEDLKVLNDSCPNINLVYNGKIDLRDGKYKHDIEISQ